MFLLPTASKATREHASKYLIKEKQLCWSAGGRVLVCVWDWAGGGSKSVVVCHGRYTGYHQIKVTCFGILTFARECQDGARATLPAFGCFGRAGVGARRPLRPGVHHAVTGTGHLASHLDGRELLGAQLPWHAPACRAKAGDTMWVSTGVRLNRKTCGWRVGGWVGGEGGGDKASCKPPVRDCADANAIVTVKKK